MLELSLVVFLPLIYKKVYCHYLNPLLLLRLKYSNSYGFHMMSAFDDVFIIIIWITSLHIWICKYLFDETI